MAYLPLFNLALTLHQGRVKGDVFWFCYTFSTAGRGGVWLADWCGGG